MKAALTAVAAALAALSADAAGAPEDRYAPLECPDGWLVHDRVTKVVASPTGLTWASAHEKAQRLNREARAADKPATAPEDRYTIGPWGMKGYTVVDRALNVRVQPGNLPLPVALAEAQRLNREARAANQSAAAAPCCDCREQMDRFRVAINKIARYGDEYSRRTADDALFAARPLAKGE